MPLETKTMLIYGKEENGIHVRGEVEPIREGCYSLIEAKVITVKWEGTEREGPIWVAEGARGIASTIKAMA